MGRIEDRTERPANTGDMFTSPLPVSPSLRRRLLPSLARLLPRHSVPRPLSPCELDRLRDRLELEHRARKEAEAVRRDIDLARAQAHTIIR